MGDTVQCFVFDYRKKKGFQCQFRHETGTVFPQPHHCFLHNFLNLFLLGNVLRAEGAQSSEVMTVDRVKNFFFACFQSIDDRFIIINI